MDHRSISNDRNLSAVPQNFTLADLEQLRLTRNVCADSVPARVTHRSRTRVLQHRVEHVAHLAFVFRRHHDDIRDRAKVSDVEQPVMCLSIAPGDPAPIQTEFDVQILNANVMDQLIESALQERRVDRANRFQTRLEEHTSELQSLAYLV